MRGVAADGAAGRARGVACGGEEPQRPPPHRLPVLALRAPPLPDLASLAFSVIVVCFSSRLGPPAPSPAAARAKSGTAPAGQFRPADETSERPMWPGRTRRSAASKEISCVLDVPADGRLPRSARSGSPRPSCPLPWSTQDRPPTEFARSEAPGASGSTAKISRWAGKVAFCRSLRSATLPGAHRRGQGLGGSVGLQAIPSWRGGVRGSRDVARRSGCRPRTASGAGMLCNPRAVASLVGEPRGTRRAPTPRGRGCASERRMGARKGIGGADGGRLAARPCASDACVPTTVIRRLRSPALRGPAGPLFAPDAPAPAARLGRLADAAEVGRAGRRGGVRA